jgi:hypothetical protein
VYRHDAASTKEILDYCQQVLLPMLIPDSTNYILLRNSISDILLFPSNITTVSMNRQREQLAFEVHEFLSSCILPPSENISTFSLLITYLSYALHRFHPKRAQRIPEVKQLLLLSDKTDESIRERRNNIQKLFHSSDSVEILGRFLGISDIEANDILQLSNGDLQQAMKKELSRMCLNHELLVKLSKEYCIYRGLLDCENVVLQNYSLEEMKHVQSLRCLREAAQVNDTVRIVEIMNGISSDYFDNNPEMLFKLKQSQFLNHVRECNFANAISLAATFTSLLTSEKLISEAKNTMLLLAFAQQLNTNPIAKQIVDRIEQQDIIGPIVSELITKLELKPPRMVELLQELLWGHDTIMSPLEDLFQLSALKTSDSYNLYLYNINEDIVPRGNLSIIYEEGDDDEDTKLEDADEMVDVEDDAPTNTESIGEDFDDDDDEFDEEEVVTDPTARENAVIQLMDIMRMDRDRAENVLNENGYSLNRVFQIILP